MGRNFISPSLVIIGKVVSLHEKFHWLQNSKKDEYYFKPIKNNLNPLNQTEKIFQNVS